MKPTRTKKITTLAMLCALAFVLALVFHFLPMPPFVPGAPFLKFEPKDIVIAIAGFLYGPLVVIPMSVIVSLLEMPLSATWLYGFIMNVASTCTFAVPAALVYREWRTLYGAGVGLALGVVTTTAVMMPLNYLITPYFMGVPKQILIDNNYALLKAIGLFNFIKYALVAAMTIPLYKPLKAALGKARLIQEVDGEKAKQAKVNAIGLVISLLVIAICTLGILYLNDVF